MKAKVLKTSAVKEVKFSELTEGDWFMYAGRLHCKTDVVDRYDSVFLGETGIMDAEIIDDNSLVEPVIVTITITY